MCKWVTQWIVLYVLYPLMLLMCRSAMQWIVLYVLYAMEVIHVRVGGAVDCPLCRHSVGLLQQVPGGGHRQPVLLRQPLHLWGLPQQWAGLLRRLVCSARLPSSAYTTLNLKGQSYLSQLCPSYKHRVLSTTDP